MFNQCLKDKVSKGFKEPKAPKAPKAPKTPNVPYISYDTLESYAHSIIEDFAPEIFSTPAQVEIDRFLEYRLGLSVDFLRILAKHEVLGLTVFADTVITAVDSNGWEIVTVALKEGSVIIDTSLAAPRKEPRLRFTMAHEAAHWLLHRHLFVGNSTVFSGVETIYNQPMVAKYTDSWSSLGLVESSSYKRMESQADYMAAAILMPKTSVGKAISDFFKFYDQEPMKVVLRKDAWNDCMAAQLPLYIAKTFNVSKQAAGIRLENLGYITGRRGAW